MNHLPRVILLSVSLSISLPVSAQLPPAAEVLPAGFKGQEFNAGASMFIKATKPNENFPREHFADLGIDLEISWMKNAFAERTLEAMASAPKPGGRNTERQPYKGGVLVLRKSSTICEDANCANLVTWRIGWHGKSPTGLVAINLNNFYGSRETAMGWIDAIIPKITRAR